jgi:hypothetical protein
LIVFALLLCVAPALWKMTNAGAAAPPPAPIPVAVTEQDIALELAFTTPPARVSIAHLGKQVWEKAAPESAEDVTLRLPWPSEGGELQFTLEWLEGAPLSAMRVKLTDPERGEIERSLWGRGPKTGVLGFP